MPQLPTGQELAVLPRFGLKDYGLPFTIAVRWTLRKILYCVLVTAACASAQSTKQTGPAEWERELRANAALFASGQTDQMESNLRALLADMQRGQAKGHLVGCALQYLGAVCRIRGRYREAEDYFHRALAELGSGPQDGIPRAWTLLAFAQLRYHTGRDAEAERLLTEALEIDRQPGTLDRLTVVSLKAHLGEIYRRQGKDPEAEKVLREALALAERYMSPDDPPRGTVLNNLALFLYKKGRTKEAIPLAEQAVEVFRKRPMSMHRDLAGALSNLAEMLAEQRRYPEAEPLFLEAISICEKSLGDRPPNMALLTFNYAQLLRKTGRKRQANDLIIRSRAILGPPGMTVSLDQLSRER